MREDGGTHRHAGRADARVCPGRERGSPRLEPAVAGAAATAAGVHEGPAARRQEHRRRPRHLLRAQLGQPRNEEKGIAKDKEIICYCHAGMRASHKYLQLKQAGFDNVRVYDGSIIDWANRRNPLR